LRAIVRWAVGLVEDERHALAIEEAAERAEEFDRRRDLRQDVRDVLSREFAPLDRALLQRFDRIDKSIARTRAEMLEAMVEANLDPIERESRQPSNPSGCACVTGAAHPTGEGGE